MSQETLQQLEKILKIVPKQSLEVNSKFLRGIYKLPECILTYKQNYYITPYFNICYDYDLKTCLSAMRCNMNNPKNKCRSSSKGRFYVFIITFNYTSPYKTSCLCISQTMFMCFQQMYYKLYFMCNFVHLYVKLNISFGLENFILNTSVILNI